MKTLLHTDYATSIFLHEKYTAPLPLSADMGKEKAVDQLLSVLKEPLNRLGVPTALGYNEKRQMLRAVLNTLEPSYLNANHIQRLDQLLQTELSEKQLTDARTIGSGGVALFQGDITTLKIDAIVNAANNQLLGCFQPLHACIDNVIHSAAGVQLRDDCHRIMRQQGFAEPTGQAKITRAYNLPSNFVIHTVGPIVQGALTEKHEQLLRDVYTNCLQLAAAIPEIRSIAFCCVSTGVFGYPAESAARTAFSTVMSWLREHPDELDLVLFNVFTNNDRALYEALLEEQ